MARPRLAPEPAGVPARRAALRLLDAVLRRGLPLEAALDAATAGLDRREDRGLAHAIAAATLRRLPDLDALIDGATQRRLPDDAKARFVLRIALAQALLLGTPAHAAIATALPLVEGGPRRLVHGVFGAVMRASPRLPDAATLPDAVARRWRKAWGETVVTAAGNAIATPPPLDLTLRDTSVVAEGEALIAGHRRRYDAPSVPAVEGFAEGEWWVQDLAASLPARLFGPGNGRSVLDLCAAPGGKTLQLAAAGWRVIAIDASPARTERLRANLDRTGLSADVVVADLLDWTPERPVDAVLLDAPCSATGIFRRHPDVLYRVRPDVVEAAAQLQSRLLARAADWVAPGGTLVYATCSLEAEEGEAQIDRFLTGRPDFVVDAVAPGELPEGVTPTADGTVRTLPGTLGGHGGMDGFYIARLRRT